jgi:hypothetical protein
MALKKNRKPVLETMVEEPTQDLEVPCEAIREEEQEDSKKQEDHENHDDHENEEH